MEDQLIGEFPATGKGGGRIQVQVWLTYHQIDGNAWESAKWVPDTFATLSTEDGETVYRLTGEPERYSIQGVHDVFTPDVATDEVFAKFRKAKGG